MNNRDNRMIWQCNPSIFSWAGIFFAGARLDIAPKFTRPPTPPPTYQRTDWLLLGTSEIGPLPSVCTSEIAQLWPLLAHQSSDNLNWLRLRQLSFKFNWGRRVLERPTGPGRWVSGWPHLGSRPVNWHFGILCLTLASATSRHSRSDLCQCQCLNTCPRATTVTPDRWTCSSEPVLHVVPVSSILGLLAPFSCEMASFSCARDKNVSYYATLYVIL